MSGDAVGPPAVGLGRRLVAGFATVGVWTMASRVLGFARDVVIAATLGTGPVAEAFFVAFTLPNLFRRFFAEGAFNTAFVPMFAARVEVEGRAAARAFASEAFAALATVLIALTLIAQLAMPWLVLALASGVAGDERFELAVAFGRVVFPYVLAISLAALLSGVLNSVHRFAAAAAAPVVLNLVLIAAVLAVAGEGVAGHLGTAGGEVTPDALEGGTALSFGVVAAGLLQLALVWRAAAREGLAPRLRLPRLTPAVRRLAVVAAPAALAGGVMQINLVVGRQVASHYEGAVGWLWYADRVYQLPLGVIGVAVGVVLLPTLARHVRAGDATSATAAVSRAAEFALVLTLPATIALLAMPEMVVTVLFQRGAFEDGDSAATALALAVYAAGLPAFVLQKVLQPVFYAREDTRAPLRFALWSMVVNVAVALAGAAVFGWLAAPLGATLAAWAQLALLWRGARRAESRLALDDRLRRRAPRMLAASLAMGALVWALARWADGLGGVVEIAALAGIVAAGMAAYALAGVVLGALDPRELLGLARRRRLD
ncbi:MAG: murein biosynthesis integral membrane protein MurJ [Paracoccaceae bacterium]